MNRIVVLRGLVILTAALFVSCGGGGGESTPVPAPIGAVAVSVSPSTASVILGATQQFAAAVTGSVNAAVTWKVTGAGTISNTGMYSAPSTSSTPVTVQVTAISVADPTQSAVATVTIPAVAVAFNDTVGSTVVGQQTVFTATVTNSTNTGVTWKVQEDGGGTVTNGHYTAPWSTGTYHVVATSKADQTKSETATVSVSAVFVFMREVGYYSFTPLLGTFTADGKFTSTAVSDPSTGQPMAASVDAVALSNDVKRIVYGVKESADNWQGYVYNLYSANVDGTEQTKLTNEECSPANTRYCDPLLVGDEVVFLSNKDAPNLGDNYDLYSIKLDGSGLTRLTTNNVFDGFDSSWYWPPASTISARSLNGRAVIPMSRAEKLQRLLQQRTQK